MKLFVLSQSLLSRMSNIFKLECESSSKIMSFRWFRYTCKSSISMFKIWTFLFGCNFHHFRTTSNSFQHSIGDLRMSLLIICPSLRKLIHLISPLLITSFFFNSLLFLLITFHFFFLLLLLLFNPLLLIFLLFLITFYFILFIYHFYHFLNILLTV